MNRGVSPAFERLHPSVQRWIGKQGWPSLRPVQEEASLALLDDSRDVLISAPTAGGKTEAAFLPIFSRLVESGPGGVRCVCVSPLKALINDQFRRLGEISREVGVPLHRWHGDVPAGAKKRVLEAPEGILLITPESLEALFVQRGPALRQVFAHVDFLVVDELHAFTGLERGRQLQSLMHRLELTARRRSVRVGLSATLGDLGRAAEFLRPGGGSDVRVVLGSSSGREVQLQLKGYREATTEAGRIPAHLERIADHLFRNLRGSDNLIFANSRSRVEQLAHLLRERSEKERVPNEFLPHHGSLSRELRTEAEDLLRNERRPGNVVCTTTLEMGIDVGNVDSVAQVGCPPSVASLNQRLGRSGRRGGQPAVLRLYIEEEGDLELCGTRDRLRPDVAQTTAMLQLMLRRWCEPPVEEALQLSTLIQQILSLIAQHGSVTALDAWQALCKSGPFRRVSAAMFEELLRTLGEGEYLSQTHQGELVVGAAGERELNHYSFFSAFPTTEEFRIVLEGRTLGSMPIAEPLQPRSPLLFAGRAFHVTRVDDRRRVVEVQPAAFGRVPRFLGSVGSVHDTVREETFRVYRSDDVPAFLDAEAAALLAEGRRTFHELGLAQRFIVPRDMHTLLFPWVGDRVLAALQLLLVRAGHATSQQGLLLRVQVPAEEVEETLADLEVEAKVAADELAALAGNRLAGKYDALLSEGLLRSEYAARRLDVEGAYKVLARMLRSDPSRSISAPTEGPEGPKRN